MKRFFIIAVALIALAAVVFMTSCSSQQNTDATDTNDTSDTAPTPDTQDTSGNTDTSTDTSADEDFVYIPYDYENNDLTQFLSLGQYDGLEVKESENVSPMTDEEFEEALYQYLLTYYSETEELTEGIAEEGQTVKADFAGYKDGNPVDNTAATNAEIQLVENSGFIPGFVENFIGKAVGETFSFDIQFPEDYRSDALKGETLTFECTINAIYGETRVPELEDVIDENSGFESPDEFRELYREYLDENNYQTEITELYDMLWSRIVDDSEIIAYPENSVEDLDKYTIQYYTQVAEAYDMTFDDFLNQYMQMTRDEIHEMDSLYIKQDLVLYSLVRELGIELTDEEYNAGVQAYASSYGVDVQTFLDEYGYTELDLRSSLLYQKTMDEIYSRIVIVED